jgi:hypothetical protein
MVLCEVALLVWSCEADFVLLLFEGGFFSVAMMGGGEARPEETTGERRKEGNFCSTWYNLSEINCSQIN